MMWYKRSTLFSKVNGERKATRHENFVWSMAFVKCQSKLLVIRFEVKNRKSFNFRSVQLQKCLRKNINFFITFFQSQQYNRLNRFFSYLLALKSRKEGKFPSCPSPVFRGQIQITLHVRQSNSPASMMFPKGRQRRHCYFVISWILQWKGWQPISSMRKLLN